MKPMTRLGPVWEGYGLDHKGDQYPLFDSTAQEPSHKEGGFNLEHSGLVPRESFPADPRISLNRGCPLIGNL